MRQSIEFQLTALLPKLKLREELSHQKPLTPEQEAAKKREVEEWKEHIEQIL